jgi:hypothetical protein
MDGVGTGRPGEGRHRSPAGQRWGADWQGRRRRSRLDLAQRTVPSVSLRGGVVDCWPNPVPETVRAHAISAPFRAPPGGRRGELLACGAPALGGPYPSLAGGLAVEPSCSL